MKSTAATTTSSDPAVSGSTSSAASITPSVAASSSVADSTASATSTKIPSLEDSTEEAHQSKDTPAPAVAARTRPVESKPIPGTEWHLVWTSDQRQFFYNSSTRISIWERPLDLIGNIIVDTLLINHAAADEPKTTPAPPSEEPEAKKAKVEEPRPEPMDWEQVDDEVKKTSYSERSKQFCEMLLEKGVSAFSTWDKELPKLVHDPRYLLLSMKERKQCFDEYLKSRASGERTEKRNKLKQDKEQFKKLLSEVVTKTSMTYGEFQLRHSRDARFLLVQKPKEREQLFGEHVAEIKESARIMKDQLATREEKINQEFFSLLREVKDINETSKWSSVKGLISSDSRYIAVGSSRKREALFKDFLCERSKVLFSSVSASSSQSFNKQDRMEASIKERERRVQAEKKALEKERTKERDQHTHEKAVQHYIALLTDMVRNPDLAWKEAKRMLKRDQRWAVVRSLQGSERKQVFKEHTDELNRKRRELFHRMLDDHQVKPSAKWKEVRRKIKDDPRCAKFPYEEKRMEEELHVYLQEKLNDMKADLRQLLKETKAITYKTRSKLAENPKQWDDIVDTLKLDRRFLDLEFLAEERDTIVRDYIDEVHRKGTPPPPTATRPSVRYSKVEHS